MVDPTMHQFLPVTNSHLLQIFRTTMANVSDADIIISTVLMSKDGQFRMVPAPTSIPPWHSASDSDSDSTSGSKLVKFGAGSSSDSDSGVGIAHLC